VLGVSSLTKRPNCAQVHLVLLAPSRVYGPFCITGAALTGIAAAAWLAERSLGWSTPIVPVVESAAAHALWLLAGLVVLTFVAIVAENGLTVRRRPAGNTPGT
jgi:fructose-specific phosphotransferase system IIC component